MIAVSATVSFADEDVTPEFTQCDEGQIHGPNEVVHCEVLGPVGGLYTVQLYDTADANIQFPFVQVTIPRLERPSFRWGTFLMVTPIDSSCGVGMSFTTGLVLIWGLDISRSWTKMIDVEDEFHHSPIADLI
jgi:hypothetical protein